MPKNGDIIVFPYERNEFVPMQPVTGWRVCMDWKLNVWTEQENFPIFFMDQILDRHAGKGWYCFINGYLGYD